MNPDITLKHHEDDIQAIAAVAKADALRFPALGSLDELGRLEREG